MPIGGLRLMQGRYGQSWTHMDSTLPPPIAELKILVMRPHYADAPPRRSPKGRWSVGFRDAWSGDRVRSATARSSVTPAATSSNFRESRLIQFERHAIICIGFS